MRDDRRPTTDSGRPIQFRHPAAVAWEEWLESDEGKVCSDPATLQLDPEQGRFLRNRLQFAFMAGHKAHELPAVVVTQTEIRKSRMIDAPARCTSCGIDYTSPTTGKLLDSCPFCGGVLVHVPERQL